jgi:hypothetical protein
LLTTIAYEKELFLSVIAPNIDNRRFPGTSFVVFLTGADDNR